MQINLPQRLQAALLGDAVGSAASSSTLAVRGVKGADLGLEPEVVPVVLPCRHPGGSAGEGHPGDPGGSPVQCRGALVGGRVSAAAAPGDSREQAEGSGQSSLPYPLPTDDY